MNDELVSLGLNNPVLLMRKMSHDMRGPLSTLTITSDLFQQGVYGPLTDKQTQAVDRIQRNSYRLLYLLEDLMTYVKAEAGQYPGSQNILDPRAVLERVCSTVAPLAEEKKLGLTVTSAEAIPVRLTGDENAIVRVVLALAWNAVFFTAQGEVAIRGDWDPDASCWSVTVRDTGPGIAPEDRPHIFEAFWRGNERAHSPTSGFGLGLAMAQALTHYLHGELKLADSGKQGSTFVLRLPLAEAGKKPPNSEDQ